MTTDQLIEAWYHASGGEDLSALDDVVTTDFEARFSAMTIDLATLKGMLEAYRRGFPGLVVETDLLHACPTAATVWAVTRGTHEGEFMGHPATGRGFQAAGLDHFTIRDGRIARLASVFDTESMLRQLGLRGGGG